MDTDPPESPDPDYDPHPTTESYPFDRYAVSDDPVIQSIVDRLVPLVKDKHDVSPRTAVVRTHLETIVINLYAAWRVRAWLQYRGDTGGYPKLSDRYNTPKIGWQLPVIMRALAEIGMIEIRKGWYDTRTEKRVRVIGPSLPMT